MRAIQTTPGSDVEAHPFDRDKLEMRGGSILIELGWPAKALSPNARVHHMAKYRFAKASKDTAFWATRAMTGPGKFPHDDRIAIVITAYPPDKQARDSDNLLASCKPHLDGIALALGVNDSLFDPRVQWGEPVKHGKIIVCVG